MISEMASFSFRSPVCLKLFLATFVSQRIPILVKMSRGINTITQSQKGKLDRNASRRVYSSGREQNSPQKMIEGVEEQTEYMFNPANEEEFPSLFASLNITSKSKRKSGIERGMKLEQKLEQRLENICPTEINASLDSHIASQADESTFPSGFQRKQLLVKQSLQTSSNYQDDPTYSSGFQNMHLPSCSDRPHAQRTSPEQGAGLKSSRDIVKQSVQTSSSYQDDATYSSGFQNEHSPSHFDRLHAQRTSPEQGVGLKNSRDTKFKPFDICLSDRRRHAFQRPSLPTRELCIQRDSSIFENGKVLRPGMVLLKGYIPLSQQVEIILRCRELGLGCGGFYQPGFQDGAKLRLQMMCLGLDWDPQTRKYGGIRQHDNSKPPNIPLDFIALVKRVLCDAHTLIKEQSRRSDVEEILPSMSPDVCIVNFYTINGRLGLHQDRDESRDSLGRGLPVVSFSIGDSAKFLFGDQRDIDKAENVLLESGDVLIFGGKSRHIFHGVTSIIPKTTPEDLLEHTKIRPGRLNLTFRQY